MSDEKAKEVKVPGNAVQGIVRRTTFLPPEEKLPERVWIGVRETENPLSTYNLFIPIVDESFLKDDPIAWDGDLVYFKGYSYELLLKSPGIAPTIVVKPSFRP